MIVNTQGWCPRRVPFGEKVHKVLDGRRKSQPETEDVFGTSPSGILDRVKREVRRLSVGLGMAPVRLYDLRHTFMERWINSAGAIETLALIAGYKSIGNRFKNFLTPQLLYDIAAAHQAKLEKEE
jgi:integrase